MKYLYHRIPNNMRGNVLYPLNQLKDIYPDVYSERLKRYKGREHIMRNKIPRLNCLWNDVIHLSAVNPKEIKKELVRVGKEITIKKFYKINPDFLDPKNTIVYLYNNPKPNDVLIEEDFVSYSPKVAQKISLLPKETIKYYAEAMNQGDKLFIWHRIPHVLHKGAVDVSNFEILEI